MCLSTPNALVTNPAGGPPSNPFHLMEFTPAALRALISEEWQVLLHAGQHLPARYGVAPFLPSFDRGGLSAGQRVNFRYWQVMLRAPWIRDLVHRAISGIPFYPQRHDYTFVADDLERAHVQYLVARRG